MDPFENLREALVTFFEKDISLNWVKGIYKINFEPNKVRVASKFFHNLSPSMNNCFATSHSTNTLWRQKIGACIAQNRRKKAFLVNLLYTSPIAIGRIPPSFFDKPMRYAPARKGCTSKGTKPAERWLTKSVRTSRAGVWLFIWMACNRWDARVPEEPGAEPFGKDRSFLSTKSEST